jgi:hypothetical protein
VPESPVRSRLHQQVRRLSGRSHAGNDDPAANAAVALAHWVPSEAIGSTLQLLINLSSTVVAGTLTLLVLRAQAEQLARRSPERAAQCGLA